MRGQGLATYRRLRCSAARSVRWPSATASAYAREPSTAASREQERCVSDESVRAHGISVRLLTEVEEGGQRPVTTDPRSRSVRRVVALGGGTGLSVLLEGLRSALFPSRGRRTSDRDRDRLTAI